MRRLNFLETTGVIALAAPVLTVGTIAALLLTGVIRIHRETIPVSR